MHLNHLQGVISLYFAKFTRFLKLELNKINIYEIYKVYLIYIYIYICAFVALDNKLQDAGHIKIIHVDPFTHSYRPEDFKSSSNF
jgi:hypothetical protein